MTSPVRLRVSPAATPTPTGVFTQWSEALFPPALEPWVTRSASFPAVCPVYVCASVVPRGLLPAALPALFSATLSPALLVYLCANVGPQGLLVVGLPAPFLPHSASLGPATATQVLSAQAAHLCPCLLYTSDAADDWLVV